MLRVKAVLRLSLSVSVFASGILGDGVQDALLKRLLNPQARTQKGASHVDNLVGRWMPGINIEIVSEIATEFEALHANRKYSWIICKIEDNRVVIESKEKGTYDDFVARLSAADGPRYAFYDAPEEWNTVHPIFFIYWALDEFGVRMSYIYDAEMESVKGAVPSYLPDIHIRNRDQSIKDIILSRYSEIQ